MGTYAEANICSLLRRDVGAAGMEGETKLVSDINSRPVDTYRNTTVDGGENRSKTDYYVANESRFRGNSTGRDCEVDRRSKCCRSCGGSRFLLESRADRWLRPHDQCVPAAGKVVADHGDTIFGQPHRKKPSGRAPPAAQLDLKTGASSQKS